MVVAEKLKMRACCENPAIYGCDFTGLCVFGCSLQQVPFSNMHFATACMINCDFSGSDFSNTNLSHSDLRGSNFENALLFGANLYHANVKRANFTHAYIDEDTVLPFSIDEALERGMVLCHTDQRMVA